MGRENRARCCCSFCRGRIACFISLIAIPLGSEATGVGLASHWRAPGVPLAGSWRAPGMLLACRWRAPGGLLALPSELLTWGWFSHPANLYAFSIKKCYKLLHFGLDRGQVDFRVDSGCYFLPAASCLLRADSGCCFLPAACCSLAAGCFALEYILETPLRIHLLRHSCRLSSCQSHNVGYHP